MFPDNYDWQCLFRNVTNKINLLYISGGILGSLLWFVLFVFFIKNGDMFNFIITQNRLAAFFGFGHILYLIFFVLVLFTFSFVIILCKYVFLKIKTNSLRFLFPFVFPLMHLLLIVLIFEIQYPKFFITGTIGNYEVIQNQKNIYEILVSEKLTRVIKNEKDIYVIYESKKKIGYIDNEGILFDEEGKVKKVNLNKILEK